MVMSVREVLILFQKMAYEFKNISVLENTIESLQCYKCQAVPGFTQDLKNRYICFNNTHKLCEKCKGECECGSRVGKNPCALISQLLKDLPVYCPHYKAGCREMFMDIENLNFHKQGKDSSHPVFQKLKPRYTNSCFNRALFAMVFYFLGRCGWAAHTH